MDLGVPFFLQKCTRCDKKEEIPLDIIILYPAESRLKTEIPLGIRALFAIKNAAPLTRKGDYNMKYEIVGRATEIKKLEELLTSKDAEFLAIYGRRRVGKTYLVRQFFKAKPVTYFEVTGLKDGTVNTQLGLFTQAIGETFFQGKLEITRPKRWLDALKLLTDCIKDIPKGQKVVLFFDELPWLATRKSGILQAIDYFWNTQWSKNPQIKLIVCGSAASWILEEIVYAKGGLHNRITARIHLKPFSLFETQEYLAFRGIKLNETQVLELYMAMGGIPHYLKAVSKGLSAAQNINAICFQPEGFLLDEFDQLLSSLFDKSTVHLEIIEVMARFPQGLSREEILSHCQRISSGGTFKQRMLELEEAGFIAAFTPYGNAKKGTYYRIIDEYTVFYLKWIHPVRRKLLRDSVNYWETKSQTQAWKIWAGFAFEAVCFKHIHQICVALGIVAIAKETGSWRFASPADATKKGTGAQVDLLLDRADGIINMCEIKHHKTQFTIDKSYANQLKNKLELFKEQTKTNKQLFLTMITTHGLTRNEYATEWVAQEITLKDLFGKN
jgi:uncharacterized protein